MIPHLEKNLNYPVGVYIKADTGYGRTGIDTEDFVSFQTVLDLLKSSKKLIFLGFLTHAGRNEIVIHGGGVHLSKESITDKSGENYYGVAVALDNYTWSVKDVIGKVTKLSQKHGIIKRKDDINKIGIEDMIAVIPIHSCLTTNLMKEFTTTDGHVISTM